MTSAPAPAQMCVIFNPTAKGEAARRFISRLEFIKRGCALKPTVAAGSARTLATAAVLEGYETIIAMGGDGTVNEVLNGIADAPDGFARARLAVLPVGTVNVFARELGLPFQFERAWEVIERGREIAIDAPCIEFQTPGQQPRWFAQMAGCGFDARAVELMSWPLKKKIGRLAYLVSGLNALREKAASITVVAGDQTYSGQLVLLGNGRFYGGPFPIFSQADFQDGLLDVRVFPTINWFVLLRCVCSVLSPRPIQPGPEHSLQARSVTLHSSPSAPVQVDGDCAGRLPAICSIRPRALRVVVPQGR